MGFIDKIYNAGDDALAYEFELTINPLSALTGLVPDLTNLSLRVNSINIPQQERGEYTIEYKTRQLVKPNGKITTATDFDFEFRVDKNWAYYKFFTAWLNIIGSDNGIGRDSGGNLRTTMTVKTIDANGVLTGNVWIFEGCWPKSIAGASLDNAGTDPINLSVTISYYDLTVA